MGDIIWNNRQEQKYCVVNYVIEESVLERKAQSDEGKIIIEKH
jgi:hypothetical protein